MFKVTSDSKEFIRELKKVRGQMELVAVNTLNEAAELIQGQFRRNLKADFVVRTPYTLNSVKRFKASAKSRSGSFRPMHDINAVVFVPKIKGEDHYLSDQEEGKVKKGAKSTKGFIPTPTDKARVGNSYKGRISRAGDLRKIGKIQNLKIDGRSIDELFRADNNQIFAVLWKYHRNDKYGWDLKKPFYLFGNVHVFKGNRFPRVRTLEEKVRRLKQEPNFTDAVEKVGTPQKMEAIFKREANRVIK